MRALDAALGAPWAILPEALERILSIAARDREVSPEALEKYRAEAVSRAETLEQRGPVAILNVVGPLFRRANLFTEFSGATSYDILRRDLQVALDNRDIRSILLNVDSPGGAAAGAGELAKAIRAAEKPVVAYVGGTGASAAYWLASAADEIIVDDSAMLGSIGVTIGLTDHSLQDEAQGVRRFNFVSSQSPLKNPPPDSDDGAASYQKIADDMAAVFVAAVAANRGLEPEAVEAGFGRGGELIGADAVAAGMADGLGSFEGVIDRLTNGEALPRASGARDRARSASGEPAGISAATNHQQEEIMTTDGKSTAEKKTAEEKAVDVDAERKDAAAAAVKADRERRSAVMALGEAKGREALAEHLLASTDMAVDEVKAALVAAPHGASAKVEETHGDGEPDPAAYDRSRLDAFGRGLGGDSATQAAADPWAKFTAKKGG